MKTANTAFFAIKWASILAGLATIFTPMMWEEFSLTSSTTILGGLLFVLAFIFALLETSTSPKPTTRIKTGAMSGVPDRKGPLKYK